MLDQIRELLQVGSGWSFLSAVPLTEFTSATVASLLTNGLCLDVGGAAELESILSIMIVVTRVDPILFPTMFSPASSPRRLRVTRSASNLRIPPVSSTTGSSLPHNTEVLASSSSSMVNVDMSDRILVPEPEADVDAIIEQQNAVGQMDATASDEESKENLRAKLRNTLSKKQSLPGTSSAGCSGVSLLWPPTWLKIDPVF